MSFLLDTNVVSEWTKPRPDPGVIRWLETVDEDSVFLSVLSLAELRHGIERLQAGDRQRRLDRWLTDDLIPRFAGRILAIDGLVAEAWGQLIALRQAAGQPMAVMDAFIAATARIHDLDLVTRDVGDFELVVPCIVNPWETATS